ncbi:hypothetical protein LOZ51_006016 [Ophidiomyces ophidiicola]|nr:hypothetical protein LOZ55_004412 [Ophidiomyces ophidiicola]KAI1986424.1 hypothetical protein LOZ51_006016 [Ophidiomyces ophidiicola]KAI1990124.1 hypothetical protein LOZ54_002618 [Ophidiomyces ophidiicola]
MSTKVVDGLWLCFRPSFARLVSPSSSLPLWPKAPNFRSHKVSRRLVSSGTKLQPHPAALPSHSTRSAHSPSENEIFNFDKEADSWPEGICEPEEPLPTGFDFEELKQAREWVRRENVGPSYELRQKNVKTLESLLNTVVGERPNHIAALRILRELIERRNIKPQLKHYRAMMLANADSSSGSALHVKSILQEMEMLGITLDSGTLHAALRALAVHPDYLIRQEILHTLRDQWLTLDPAGWHSVVIGLLRERQYELALDNIEEMEAQGIQVKPWLYALTIYNLADAEEYDEVLNLMQPRITAGQHLSTNLWFHLLDKASSAIHKALTSYIWKQQVQRGHIIPSYGVCNNVLAICARTGDVELAISVFEILDQRKAIISLDNYESLLDTYVMAGDFDSAVRVLCTMENANLGISEPSTRLLLSAALRSDIKAQDLWRTLKELRTEENRLVPVVAANIAIQLCAKRGNIEEAMDIYRELHIVCCSGPSSATFDALFGACRKSQRTDMISFFLQEMQLLNILPTQSTYEILIVLCVDLKHFEIAHRYLLEMAQSGFSLTEASKRYIRMKCAQSDLTAANALRHDILVRKPVQRGYRKLTANTSMVSVGAGVGCTNTSQQSMTPMDQEKD